MTSRNTGRTRTWMMRVALFAALAATAHMAYAQAAASRFLGSITAIAGDTLTVKTDAGEVHQVEVPSTAAIKRIAPGQTNLSNAVAMEFSGLATGDRVLVRLDPNATGATPQATMVVAIKQEDVAQKQAADREDWQKRGVGGLVKSVDASGGVIVLTSGAGPSAKTITVHTTPTTVLKRYAAGSVSFDQAQAAPITAIQAGDQLRARGAKSADGMQLTAEEVVSGGFRNISGTIVSTDTANSTLVVKDLATKKQVTIHLTPEVQMRRLPDRMAQFLAARLKGDTAGRGGAAGSGGGQGGNGGGQRAAGQGGAGGPGGAGGGDPQQILNRADVIKLSDLTKGEAVMLVSTQGTTDVTAITLLAGVEPLLEAPAASNLLSNWSMGSGSPEEAQ